MDFDFSPEQYAFRDAVRALLEKEVRLREVWAAGGERDDRLHRAMAELGIFGVTVPEEFGGTGGDETDLQLVLEEAGRAGCPEPVAETAAVAVPLLVAAGTDEQRAEWLPKIASGEARVAVGFGLPFTLDADLADVLLVEASGHLHAVPRGSFTAERITSEDRARRLFRVKPKVSKATRTNGGAAAVAEALDRGAAATAAVLNGVSMRLLERTVEYVRERQQFGRPVGSFQAVKHKLASAHVLVESARSASWYAAYAIARGLRDAPLAASAAKVQAAEAGAVANTEALQCHAGIGFTWEHDLHFWLKRGKALEHAFGTPAMHRARLGSFVLEEEIDA